MTSVTETKAAEARPSGEYQPVDTEATEPKLTRGSWIGMVVVAAIVAGVVIFGISARHGSERTLEKETAASAIPRSTLFIRSFFPFFGDRASRQYAGIHRFAHLLAYKRLSQGLVLRHRRACSQRTADGCNRNSGAGPAVAGRTGRPEERAG